MTTDHLEYINRVVMTGYVVRDPEFRHTTTGTPVSNFRIAATKRIQDRQGTNREEICYVGVAAWHDLAEGCHKLLVKGSAVMVEGELKSRVRESGDGVRRSFVEIRASKIRLYRSESDYFDMEDTGEHPDSVPAGGATRSDDGHDLLVTDMPEQTPAGTMTARSDYKPYNTIDSEEL